MSKSRSLHWTAMVRMSVTFGTLFWLFCIFNIADDLKHLNDLASYKDTMTVQVDGGITHVAETKTSSGRRDKHLGWAYTYSYTFNELSYKGKSFNKGEALYHEGDNVTVSINPDHPEISQLQGTTNIPDSPVTFICILVLLVLCLLINLWIVRNRLRILKHGVFHPAKIEPRAAFMFAVSYSFGDVVVKNKLWGWRFFGSRDTTESIIFNKNLPIGAMLVVQTRCHYNEESSLWTSPMAQVLPRLAVLIGVLGYGLFFKTTFADSYSALPAASRLLQL